MTTLTLEDFIRPSSLDALDPETGCPGRARMESRAVAAIPALARLSSEQADIGTTCHRITAQWLSCLFQAPVENPDPKDVERVMGNTLKPLSEWDQSCIRKAVAYAVALVAKHKPTPSGVHIEVRLTSAGLFQRIYGGTADLVILKSYMISGRWYRDAIVVDWKFGFLSQGEARDSRQLAAYAFLAAEHFNCVNAEVHLFAPRLDECTAVRYERKDLDSFQKALIHTITQARSEDAECRPSLKACRYCKALVICRAVREAMMKAIDSGAIYCATTDEERMKLNQDATLCRRFAEEAAKVQKEWQTEQQAAKPETKKGGDDEYGEW